MRRGITLESRAARAAFLLIPILLGADVPYSAPSEVIEPNYKLASHWWPDLPDIWTPIGWKDHLFRFNVFFNGTIAAQPVMNRRTEQWANQGVQLSFLPSRIGVWSPGDMPGFPMHDDGSILQGYEERESPLLWTEWAYDGLLLRQQVFAHVPGGKPIESGTEPLFAWVRLSIVGGAPGLPLDDEYGFAIKLNYPHIAHTMAIRNNLLYRPDESGYPRPLKPNAVQYDPAGDWQLLEPDGRVRLAVPRGQTCTLTWTPGKPTERDSLLYIRIKTRPGTHVDLLLPMLPTAPGEMAAELKLGYEAALAEADRYWSQRPSTAATFDIPEAPLNRLIDYNLKYAEIIAERNPATGNRSLLTSSWVYANLWATPMAQTCIMFLDTLGYHVTVEKYLEQFQREQGTVTPPGDAYQMHPGYLSTPKSLAAINWLSDHGAILYTISEHALLSGDRAFINRWLPTILKACDLIRDARRLPHNGVKGLMPPAVATDRGTQIQAVWNDGWMYKGLTTSVRLLEQVDHPRAVELRADANEYRDEFQRALRERCETMPTWQDDAGQTHHLVPTAISGDTPDEVRHAFYLDTGPLFLVFAGLLDADDPMMRSTLLWFRSGPPTRLYRQDGHCFQTPSLRHEMSSCEPCYSWNLFHSWQLGDRQHLFEGMYSFLAGAVSRKTFSMCESRGGITGVTPALSPVYLARLAVIDDQIAPNELHLLRLIPIAWLTSNRPARFVNVPTEFGPVDVQVRLSDRRDELQIEFHRHFRREPSRVVLHIPPVSGIKTLSINGRRQPATTTPLTLSRD